MSLYIETFDWFKTPPNRSTTKGNQTMTGIAHQIEVLQRIAEFSAQAHGHSLNPWRTSEYSATAACSSCGSTVTVYVSLLQPDMEGSALSAGCDAAKRGQQCNGEAA